MKTKKKATENHSIISLKKLCQFTDNKKQESVERHNPLQPEETWHFENSFQQKNEKKGQNSRLEIMTGCNFLYNFIMRTLIDKILKMWFACDDYLNLLFFKSDIFHFV